MSVAVDQQIVDAVLDLGLDPSDKVFGLDAAPCFRRMLERLPSSPCG